MSTDNLSLNMGHTTNMIALAESMVSEMCGTELLDDAVKRDIHIERLNSLLHGTLEHQKQMEQEVDSLINKVQKGGVA